MNILEETVIFDDEGVKSSGVRQEKNKIGSHLREFYVSMGDFAA